MVKSIAGSSENYGRETGCGCPRAEHTGRVSQACLPKDEFNSKVGELKAANKTIEDLKKANGDNAELQKQIGEYKEQVKQLQTSAVNTAKTYALKEQLAKEGVLDPDYLIYKAGGIDFVAYLSHEPSL